MFSLGKWLPDQPATIGVKMDAFKAMLAETLTKIHGLEHRFDVPYMLLCEAKYLKAVIEDVDQRMNKDCNGYKES